MTSTQTSKHNSTESLRERFRALPADSIADSLVIENGSIPDYHALSEFHYKAFNPGATTTVYRLMHRAPSVVGRYLQRNDETKIVGILMRSLPSLGCKLRDHATNNRYRGFGARGSGSMLNREVRTISRVVIDPRWRGLGLAVRLVRHALANPETMYTEALAAMGRVHPFFEKAGMTRYDRPIRAEHARLLDALHRLNIEPHMLASPQTVAEQIQNNFSNDCAWFDAELRHWHQTAFRTTNAKLYALSFDELITSARDHLLSQPVYYITRHEQFINT